MLKKILPIFVAFMLFATAALAAGKNFTLVIDAGHGGHDAGARGAISLEKNINLSVALAFGRYVERYCPDVRVIYTRKTDVFVPLHERARIANKNKADIFISIHTNSLPKGRIARGIETYTMGMRRAGEKLSAAQRENAVIMIEKDYKQHYEGYDPNSPESAIMFEFMHDKNMAESVELAKHVQANICATTGRANKGVKQDVFLVLRETSMPACLIELGFISTPDEEQFLNKEKSIDDLARGIYLAFVKYRNAKGGSFTVPFEPSPKTESEVKEAEMKNRKAESTVTEAREKADNVGRTVAETGTGNADGGTKAQEGDVSVKAKPVFKVQILATDRVLKAGSPLLKGCRDASYYREGNYVKYTCGASEDYNEIYRLRKTLLEKFPQAFIIAFKDGQKMNVVEAIREFKSNRK
ncbi:MAG: N-acetylmuramoyl-L-alanine amidase [Prevotella sp.]|nr:N-acetylmuramoyl-L-alanine amidase [Prevotella sp.]